MKNKIILAGCVIQNKKGKILLLHRNTPKRVQWETPGGKIEAGEDSKTAAKREIKEELGIDVDIVGEMGQKEFIEDGFIMHYVWYKSRIVKGEPKLKEKKFDEFRYFSWQELKNRKELSQNTQNLVNAYFEEKIKV